MIKANWIQEGPPQPLLLFEICVPSGGNDDGSGDTGHAMTPHRQAFALAFGGLGMIAGLRAAITEPMGVLAGPDGGTARWPTADPSPVVAAAS